MKIISLFLIMSVTASLCLAGGPGEGGGGDVACENRFKIVRDDIENWILQGGPKGLELPNGISADQYSLAMLRQIKAAKIKCVGLGDEGHPVEVNGTPKECRFDSADGGSRITCDYEKFNRLNESNQYVLVHHEYAGLAGIEIPKRDDSSYNVSNQISAYLENQVVKKLAIKPFMQARRYWCSEDSGYGGDKYYYGVTINQEKMRFEQGVNGNLILSRDHKYNPDDTLFKDLPVEFRKHAILFFNVAPFVPWKNPLKEGECRGFSGQHDGEVCWNEVSAPHSEYHIKAILIHDSALRGNSNPQLYVLEHIKFNVKTSESGILGHFGTRRGFTKGEEINAWTNPEYNCSTKEKQKDPDFEDGDKPTSIPAR